jgi:crotonobetaine/carnitine-CoA ligase
MDGLGKVRRIVVVGDAPDIPIHGLPVVPWDEWLPDRPALRDDVFPAFDQLCYLPFTSGTTGRQKGGMYSHHFLYLYSAAISDSLGRTADDVVSTPLPLYHVAAVHMITNSALQAGCTAHLKSRFSASRYWDEIAADRATYSLILGPMAAIILKTAEAAPEHRMTKVFCVPPPPGRREFEERYGVEMLWQGYGSTEVFPLPMPAEMEPGVPEDTLGHPVSWMDYGVVDEHDQLVGPGVTGEFVFRPRIPYGMVDGYYGDPLATATAFRNFMFHTGDHGAYDEEGRLHYRGRKQDRMRVKGENVSAQELEFVVLGHDAVLEAAAYGLPSEFGEEEIKLDVVLRDDVAVAELHVWMTESLPRFMVPRYVEVVDAFPKTPTERIEKWKLKERSVERPEVFDAGGRGARRS